jgi:hypothetical protein
LSSFCIFLAPTGHRGLLLIHLITKEAGGAHFSDKDFYLNERCRTPLAPATLAR